MKSLAEAKKFIKDNGVKYILAQFADIHGVAKVKSVPSAHLEDILTAGAGFAGGAIWGTGIAPNGPDYMAVGELATLGLVPWQTGYARIVCDGHVNGKPYEYDARVVLKKQLDKMAKKGWTFYTGLEPEFSLLKRNEHGAIQPCDDTDLLQKPCYDYKGITRQSAYLEKLTESLLAVGMDVYQIDHEDANGQFEVNYTYTDALKSADNYIMFKMAASEIANQMGMICSFMPKPFSNRPGNGMHMHMSIGDGKTKNIFHDDSDKNGLGLSKLAYHFLAGILEHAPALTAICNPSVNSYKRLVVGRSLTGATWAPAYIAYGDNNRSTLVRIPYGRLEFRLPDGSCNPYLATAAVIAAGLDGVKRELSPGKPRSENLYDYSLDEIHKQGIGILPQNLGEALTALEKDKVIRDALGDKLSQEFIDLKRMEWVDYQRHVSDWEVNRYVEFY
ncbi:type III glutamate--ammonia ligase [Methyloradius palustris]|uniref:Type III glutamate--ammonia ligase n=1 Tax=Methyloradius palustris TaxID=2778876 RepID=A0A8D5GCS7_9PROT|nr:type III glutamate--ammonia ligase [Methyloradius palustris]BCM25083.1 type III glutamate--ammonia ligase [Methyloradius palustris]